MMREWTKPEMYSEEFVLDQHIAKGCGSTVVFVPGTSKTGDLTCWQENGNGHWVIENVTVVDTNMNGVLDYAEILAAVPGGTIKTGQGHAGHGIALEVEGEERVQVIENLS